MVSFAIALVALLLSDPAPAPHAAAARGPGDAGPKAPDAASVSSVAPLSWIAGCWQMLTRTGVVEEQWMSGRGETLLGMSRTVRADTLAEYEFLLIRIDRGHVVYEAHPSGQPAASFAATAVSETLAIFEDPSHDFPQTISYRAVGPDSLVARVEGVFSGEPRVFEYRYVRVACPGR